MNGDLHCCIHRHSQSITPLNANQAGNRSAPFFEAYHSGHKYLSCTHTQMFSVFILLAIIENALRLLKGKPILRLNDSIASLSSGIFQDCFRLVFWWWWWWQWWPTWCGRYSLVPLWQYKAGVSKLRRPPLPLRNPQSSILANCIDQILEIDSNDSKKDDCTINGLRADPSGSVQLQSMAHSNKRP